MSEQSYLRLRMHLDMTLDAPVWPLGVAPVAFDAVDPHKLHAVLEEAFPGLIAPFEDWYGNLTHDEEFDPDLCIAALTADGRVAGFVQCWTSNFIKDLAVARRHRGKGVGAALLYSAFGAFKARGAAQVDLKVDTENADAQRLYARVGMVKPEA